MTTDWRLAVEPVAGGLAWSLMADDGSGTHLVDAQYEPDTFALCRTASRSLAAKGHDLWTSGLATPSTERALASMLGRSLLPAPLRSALLDLSDKDERPMLTIATRGWPAQVPWPSLALADAVGPRLIERACVIAEAGPSLVVGRARADGLQAVSSSDTGRGPRLALIDPGPVAAQPPRLYLGRYPAALLAAFDPQDLLGPGGGGCTPEDAAALLHAEAWGQFVFVGHVRAGTEAEPALAAMAFSASGKVRWFTAREWIAAPDAWPMPKRVALIGCASGDEVPREQSGLTLAAINAGAQLVVTTRWPLPVRHPGGGPDSDVLTPTVVAITQALATDRPVETLRRWQAEQVRRWVETGSPQACPLTWAALTLTVVPALPATPDRPLTGRQELTGPAKPVTADADVEHRLTELEAAQDRLDHDVVNANLAAVGELVEHHGTHAQRRRYAVVVASVTVLDRDPVLLKTALDLALSDQATEDHHRMVDLIRRGSAAVGRLMRRDAHHDLTQERAVSRDLAEFLAEDHAIPPTVHESLLIIAAAVERGLGDHEREAAYRERARTLSTQRTIDPSGPDTAAITVTALLDLLLGLLSLKPDQAQAATALVEGLPDHLRPALPMELLRTKARQLNDDHEAAYTSCLAGLSRELRRTRALGSSRDRSHATRGIIPLEAAATALELSATLGDPQRTALVVELLRAQGVPAATDPLAPSVSKVMNALAKGAMRDDGAPPRGQADEALDVAETLLGDPPPLVMPWGDLVPGTDPDDPRAPIAIRVLRSDDWANLDANGAMLNQGLIG